MNRTASASPTQTRGSLSATLLIASSGGYGFLANVEHMLSRQRAGKAFVTVGEGEALLAPSHAQGTSASVPLAPATHVACVSTLGRVLSFDIGELKLQSAGGRGLMLISLDDKDTLAGVAAYTRSVRLTGIGRGGKPREETLEIRSLSNARGSRGKKGKATEFGFKVQAVTRVE